MKLLHILILFIILNATIAAVSQRTQPSEAQLTLNSLKSDTNKPFYMDSFGNYQTPSDMFQLFESLYEGALGLIIPMAALAFILELVLEFIIRDMNQDTQFLYSCLGDFSQCQIVKVVKELFNGKLE
ncbi:unnamed protein product [Moneuplotes crassus]|uniref:Uncharacterized protein n=1 Tax=Euplotes crassus TaxID=5936 RepID=A0AAD1Y071_EUPCR|nr:unnamed protein product [Moneuplotes crassus]